VDSTIGSPKSRRA